MSVSLICSATNPIISRALVTIARPGAIRTVGAGSMHARMAVIGPRTRQRAAAAFSLSNRISSLARMSGMLSGADVVSSPEGSVVHLTTMDRQRLIDCQHVPPSCFGLFKFTPIQPPLSSIEPHGQS